MERELRLAMLTLASVRGVGPVAFREALARTDGVDAALAVLSPSALREAAARVTTIERDAATAGARLMVQGDAAYPKALLDLEDAPPFLFSLGDIALLRKPAVAMVGTRDATSYGARIATRLANELSAAGVAVVSGLARGIDAAAHRGALQHDGATVAVVAGGVDIPTPPRHRELHQTIARQGVVLSEQRCGSMPRPGTFPRRNRLIAALGAATVVIEAGVRSGALLTASMANDIGRPVGAVPGGIESAVSCGTNGLIRDGAVPITSTDDILLLAGFSSAARGREGKLRARSILETAVEGSPLERQLWDRLRREPASLDRLVAESAESPRALLRALTVLEVAGLVRAEAATYVAT